MATRKVDGAEVDGYRVEQRDNVLWIGHVGSGGRRVNAGVAGTFGVVAGGALAPVILYGRIRPTASAMTR